MHAGEAVDLTFELFLVVRAVFQEIEHYLTNRPSLFLILKFP